MIVDTMTFEEIAKYLWNTGFSEDTVSNALLQKYYRHQTIYRNEIKKWERLPIKDKYRIFKPIKYKARNDEVLISVPYSSGKKYIDFVHFLTFNYRNRKYVAFRLNEPGSVLFFSWHSIQRYAERFLNDMNPVIDEVFIGDMLIYNTATQSTSYRYKGHDTIMLVSTDGAFLCDSAGGNFIARTFISQNEYFSNQAALDAEAIEDVKVFKKIMYNDTIDR